MRRELLLGAGANHRKKMQLEGTPATWTNLTTLDSNADHEPDVVWNLECLPLPFEDDSFDEIHAYEVLEHTGRQGDFRFFFAQFEEFYRILKPGGYLCGSSPAPNSKWLWGDPGHTRSICEGLFTFLSQREYEEQVGVSAMSDYRFCYSADFEKLHCKVVEGDSLIYALEAIKPTRKNLPLEAGVNDAA